MYYIYGMHYIYVYDMYYVYDMHYIDIDININIKPERKGKKTRKERNSVSKICVYKTMEGHSNYLHQDNFIQVSCVSSHGEVRLQTLPHTCASHNFFYLCYPFLKERICKLGMR